uniref:Uncharacterized protein n=1 Tax=Arundo donax TaxID=35708 RepID=A0A0A8ZF93_ARUDO
MTPATVLGSIRMAPMGNQLSMLLCALRRSVI